MCANPALPVRSLRTRACAQRPPHQAAAVTDCIWQAGANAVKVPGCVAENGKEQPRAFQPQLSFKGYAADGAAPRATLCLGTLCLGTRAPTRAWSAAKHAKCKRQVCGAHGCDCDCDCDQAGCRVLMLGTRMHCRDGQVRDLRGDGPRSGLGRRRELRRRRRRPAKEVRTLPGAACGRRLCVAGLAGRAASLPVRSMPA
jgi:hypothetical protein